MKHLKPYKVFESTGISKAHLVDRIRWYSNNLHQYMKDVNKYTTSNLNFSLIFEAADMLHHDSPDGFITAICNEFIIWSEYMINQNGVASDLFDYRIDKGYEHFTDEYKQEHKHELYRQPACWLVYAATGRDLKESIAGTIWDIPLKKTFTDEDNEFIIDSILSDLEIDDNYLKPATRQDGTIRLYKDAGTTYKFRYRSVKRGIIFKIPQIKSLQRIGITYDCDFINRLQSYFSGALILDRGVYSSDIIIYLPFYK